MPFRKGPASRAEKEFVRKHLATLSPEEMSERLNRHPYAIANMRKAAAEEPAPELEPLPAPLPSPLQEPDSPQTLENRAIRSDLKNSETWKAIKAEFNTAELRYFEEAFLGLMRQFKNDVKASERTQIFQAVRFEVLMNRNMRERRRAHDDIANYETVIVNYREQLKAKKGGGDEKQQSHLLKLEEQVVDLKRLEQTCTNEYVKLQERHAKLMESLKALRDQRLKVVENADKDFLGVVKMLMERDAAEREGRQTGLMRLAGEKEHTRLGRPHKYEDGSVDSPILSSDTVDLGPEEEGD